MVRWVLWAWELMEDVDVNVVVIVVVVCFLCFDNDDVVYVAFFESISTMIDRSSVYKVPIDIKLYPIWSLLASFCLLVVCVVVLRVESWKAEEV